MHGDAEPAGGPGVEGEGAVVCLGDAFDDCQAEADTGMVRRGSNSGLATNEETFESLMQRSAAYKNRPRAD